MADDVTVTGSATSRLVSVFLDASDPDTANLYARLVSLPARGQIYDELVDPAYLISSTNYVFPAGDALKFLTATGNRCPPDAQDYGFPYTTFEYQAWDPNEGLASPVATVTVNMPAPTPLPIPTSATNYVTLFNTILPVTLSGTNPSAPPSAVFFTVLTPPTNGVLSLFGIPIRYANVSLPPSSSNTLVCTYTPSAPGMDQFTWQIANSQVVGCPITTTITEAAPPTIGGQSSLTVTENTNGVTILPGVIHAVVVQPSSAGSNSVLMLTVQSASPPGGTLTLASTNGLINLSTNNLQLEFSGTASAINAALARGISYSSGPGQANQILMIVNDLGAAGYTANLLVTNTLTVNYFIQGGIIGDQ